MKIRTKKDVENLDRKIQEELGIDVKKYRNQEVAESFGELLVFPAYILNWTIRPVLFSVLVYILGFTVIDLVHIEYLIYGIFGLILFLVTGILGGLFFLTWKMKSDMWGIIEYSLGIMKSAVEDLNLMNDHINPENRKDVLGLLFKGIIHIVTIPMLSKVISDKVPLLGGIVNWFVKKILTRISDIVKFDEIRLKEELKVKNPESSALNIYIKSITATTTGLNKLVNVTFGIAQLPLKIFLGIFLFLTALFVYLIW